MQQWLNQLSELIFLSKQNLVLSVKLVAIFWLVHIVNLFVGMRLNIFGILPRHPFGLIGVATSPFLHGNIEHLFFNSIAMFVLFDLMLIYGVPVFLLASIIIMIVGGLGVWLFARRGIHIGASGLMLGYWMFLLVNAYFERSVMAVVLAALCLYYLAALGLSLLPGEKATSWEAHVFGAVGGVVAVYAIPYILPRLGYY